MTYSSERSLPTVETLKKIRENFDWEVDKERSRFLIKISPIIKDWRHKLPDIQEIFSSNEIDLLLTDSINFSVNTENIHAMDSCEHFIKFIARCGYIDESEDDKSFPRRTPVHVFFRILSKLDSFDFEPTSAEVREGSRNVTRRRCRQSEEKGGDENYLSAETLIKRHENLYALYSDIANDLINLHPRFDINYTDSKGLSHFHVACAFGCFYVVERFLELGQDPNCILPIKTGHSPLHLALKYGHREIADLLLNAGADPNAINVNGSRPVHELCKSIHGEDLVDLLSFFSNDIDFQDELGNTPLHLAARRGHKKVIKLLLKKGANLNLVNSNGETALHTICMSKDADVAKILLRRAKQQMQIDALDKSGNSPMLLALKNGHIQLAKSLVELGADPNKAEIKGLTGLHIICSRKNDHYWVDAFLKRSRKMQRTVEIDPRDSMGNTPLLLALMGDNNDTAIESLLLHGADPTISNRNRSNALHIISQNEGGRAEDVAKMLLKMCDDNHLTLDIDAPDNSGWTPLFYALSSNKKDLAAMLLRRGADPNLASDNGLTALHIICKLSCNDNLAQIFFEITDEVEMQVKLDVRDKSGQTPLQLAVASLLPNTIDALLNRGADFSSFVFPSENIFAKNFAIKSEYCDTRFSLASCVMVILEKLINKGYELNQVDANTLMKLFSQYRLFENSDIEKSDLHADESFVTEARDMMVKPSLSLYDLIGLQKKAELDQVTFEDYWAFANSSEWQKLSQRHHEACALHLCEIMCSGFFRRWAIYPFWELIQQRLPLECCEMIFDNLKNEDICNTCLASQNYQNSQINVIVTIERTKKRPKKHQTQKANCKKMKHE